MTQTFIRPKDVHIWEMCVWLNQNMSKVLVPGANVEDENKAVIYLYHIVDSLAKKEGFFKDFSFYDEFSLYAAGELFISLRNKINNSGKTIRGKQVKPVKNSLDYIKSVLYPLKVNFEKANYNPEVNREVGHDVDKLADDMRAQVRQQYQRELIEDLQEVAEILPKKVHEMLLSTSPYRNDDLMMKRIYISCILTLLNQLTLPNKARNKLDAKKDSLESDKISNLYINNEYDVLLWHLPDHMREYIRILVVKIKRMFTDELYGIRNSMDLTDEVIDGILATAFTTYDQDKTGD